MKIGITNGNAADAGDVKKAVDVLLERIEQVEKELKDSLNPVVIPKPKYKAKKVTEILPSTN